MLRLSLLVLMLVPFASASAAPAPKVAAVAAALAETPVFVAPGSKPTLTAADADALRLSSEQESESTVLIAVVPASIAARDGQALKRYANQVDRRLPAEPHTLLVSSGRSVWLVTTGGDADARAVVQEAFDAHKGDLAAALTASVEGLAPLTPRAAEVPGAPDAGLDEFDDLEKDITETIETGLRIGAIIGVVIFTLPFVLLGGFILFRVRRARAATADTLSVRREHADARLLSLGEQIRAHDLDVQMPGASPEGVAAYGHAIAAYDEANSTLTLHGDDLGVKAMSRVERALQQGEAEMGSAIRLLATPQPADATGLPG